MEFGVSPFPESRRAMIDRGRLFGVPTYRWVPAMSRVEVEYWIVAPQGQRSALTRSTGPDSCARAAAEIGPVRAAPATPGRAAPACVASWLSINSQRRRSARACREGKNGRFLSQHTSPTKDYRIMRLLCTLSLAAALAAVTSAPMSAQATGTTKAPAAGAAKQAPAAGAATKQAPAAKAGAGRTVELTGGDDMKYSMTAIQAKPGETLHIVLKNIGTVPKVAMAHNFVALKAGVDAAKFSRMR